MRLLIPLVAGVIVEKNFPLENIFLVPAFCLSVLLVISCNFISIRRFFGMNWTAGLAIQLSFFTLGRMMMHIHRDINIEESSCFSKNCSNLLLLRVLSDPVLKQRSWKTVVKVIGLIKDQRCFVENENVLVYFNKNIDAGQVSGGLLMITNKKLTPIQNIKGVNFDYVGYCHLKHIYAQLFLTENDFVVIGNEHKKTLFSVLTHFRKNLVIVLKKQIPGKSENGFLEALLFGYTDDLEPALLKSYADTGVIHIIAISGLHLALICQLMQMGLRKLGRSRIAIWVNLILILSVLWAYGLFSGASPSVIRAAAMFSLVLFARNILRETTLFNTLASSAFLLVCFDPFWLWDAGFQLSYAAITGLGVFAGPLQNCLALRNKILRSVWKAVSVSIAAQVLTTPLSIYYFHQFPLYFLFANLLAVPLSSAILVGGILLCIFCALRPFADLLGWVLNKGVQALNGIILYFSNLPEAVVGGLELNLTQLVSIYLIIFCFFRFLREKNGSWFIAGLSGIAVFRAFHFL